jgi:hypothetical protein
VEGNVEELGVVFWQWWDKDRGELNWHNLVRAIQEAGYAIVPKEITLDMKLAGWSEERDIMEGTEKEWDFRLAKRAEHVWRAQLAAAPDPLSGS